MKLSLRWSILDGVLIAVGTLIPVLVLTGDPLSLKPAEPPEKHLQNLTQLTFGGQNAEAYFSFDGTKIIFQSTRQPYGCDQIFSMNVDGGDVRLLNNGKGRTTCGFFLPHG